LLFLLSCRVAGDSEAGASPAASLLALAPALLYLVLALDVRATDDGLNIALYQALPEGLLLLLLLRPPARHPVRHAAAIGVTIFAAWFVKQSSLLPAALMLAAFVSLQWRNLHRAWWLGMVLGGAIPLAAFGLHLALSHTWDNYWLGTHEYRASLIPTLREEFVTNAMRAYGVPFWKLQLASFLAAHRVWTGLATLVLAVVASHRLVASRGDGWSLRRTALLFATAWMVGAWAQAVAGLTFFPHYFLASLAPVAAVIALLLVGTRAMPALAVAGCLVAVTALLGWSYVGMRADNARRAEQAPINRSTRQVLAMLRPGDRIFNWSGLPHAVVAHGEPSAFPLNMHWPYIMTALPAQTRTRMLMDTLRDPPDVVIAIAEDYPPNQHLVSEPMTVERLRTLTGLAYSLVLETPRQPGRYGAPVKVFRRDDAVSPPPRR
jgi:hypothetical protein